VGDGWVFERASLNPFLLETLKCHKGAGLMSEPAQGPSDERVEQFLSNLLRAGVLFAAAVVLLGALLYLGRHGSERKPDEYRQFKLEQSDLLTPAGIVGDALALSSRGIIQLGLLLLIATPVARVFFSALAFARQRDWLYVVLTLIVLTVLLGSLFFGNLYG
jgi:uncharacterized membrane protein